MLFVRNHRGISHHPAESVAVADVAPALQAYLQAVSLIAERS
jgi:allantoate deiminase